jgi:hypothetical protein
MPRFSSNRWWTFILTIIALHVVSLSTVAKSKADPLRSGVWTPGGFDETGSGGAPPPQGVGDPDQPVSTRLKYYQRGQLGAGGALHVSRTAGDRRVTGDVWMVRLLVMQRLLRSMLYRF